MCLNVVLQMYSMIACLRLKSDLGGGGETPNSLRNTGGGAKVKRYHSLQRGGGGSKMTKIGVT